MTKIKDFFYNSKVSYAIVLLIMLVMAILLSLGLENSRENKPGDLTVSVTALTVMAVCYILCKYVVHASNYMDKKRAKENRKRWGFE